MGNEINMQISEAYTTPNRYDWMRISLPSITLIIPEAHHKDKILKVIREKQQIHIHVKPIRITDTSIKQL